MSGMSRAQLSLAEVDTFVATLSLAFASGLAAVHLLAGRLRFLNVIPRSRWLSISGGVAVAYVFVHILPEIQSAGTTIEQSDSVLIQVEEHVYLISLVGFIVFYGLERLVREAKEHGEGSEYEVPSGVFWIHITSFAIYNALIGYLLLHREEPGVVSLTLFFTAMALHFVVNDYGLRQHHGRSYHRYGRWILSSSVLLGFTIGYLANIGELLLAVLFAFLAGGVILNVIKEELPEERQSNFWAFTVGAVGYTIVLLLL